MIDLKENIRGYQGEIQIITKDKSGRIINVHRENNLIKIFAKEMLAHSLPYSKIWDPNAESGTGAWVSSGIDITEEFAAKYILLGASYDEETGQPLDTHDSLYYVEDTSINQYIPRRPQVGADNNGDLIRPIKISEPGRPLKRIERIAFYPSYQPSDTPLIDNTVRAINNVLVLETTLKQDEYNGFGTSNADFFTITEVSLAGGKALDTVGACECPPKYLFLEGVSGANNAPIPCTASGSATITIDSGVALDDVNSIKEGDQIFIVAQGGSSDYDTLQQVQPHYLVTAKSTGGRDITLDRTPQADSDSASSPVAITGPIGIYRSTLRLFSQRILSVPFKKSVDFEITIRWLIYFN